MTNEKIHTLNSIRGLAACQIVLCHIPLYDELIGRAWGGMEYQFSFCLVGS